jgi:HlyD family secretion protein
MSLRIRGKILPLIALAGLVFAVVSVIGKKSPAPVPIATTPPQASYAQTIAGIGVVEPKSEVINLGVELPGVVRSVAVKVGEAVKKGQLLFTLDTREVEAQITTLKASLASAKIQSQDASTQYALIAGVKDKRAVARDEVNRRRYAKELAESRVKEIAAQLQQAETTKERLNVRAPITGRILEVNVRVGEYAAAGVLAAPLMRIGDVSTLHVRLEVDEENAGHISSVSGAKGFRRGDTTHPVALSFVRFEPFVRAKQNLAVAGQRVDTRVLQVIYAITSPPEDMYVGQQMDVFIDSSEAPSQHNTGAH